MSLQEGGGELLLRIISYCFPDDFFFWHPPVVNWRRMSYVFDEYVYETPGFSLRYFCYAIYVYYKKWSLLSNNRKRSLFLHSLEIWWLWSIIFTTSISIWVCLWLHASMHSFLFMFIHSLLLLGADTLRLWSDFEIVFQYRVSLEFTNKIATTHLPVVKII